MKVGADCVLFTAATSSSAPLSQMCKKKGKVVLVGMELTSIKKNLISTSYGPGRYEEKGIDYPYAYVRIS